jgi:NTE family protein
MTKNPHEGFDGTIYLFHGGGALGAYQVGVYKGLSEYGYNPDWVIGTSIGAINGAIIAGNIPEKRVKKCKNFGKT